jgi:chitodextrinase
MRSAILVLACAILASGCIQVQVPTTVPPATEPLPEGPTYQGPTVEFSWDPAAPRVGQATTFSPEVRVLRGTHIATWSWDFGDGGKSATPNAEHAFGSAGLKTVTLTVRSSDGMTGTTSHVVPVAAANAAPAPSGSGSDGGAALDLPDPVIASVADPDRLAIAFSFSWSAEPDTVGWDFGDGASSNLLAPEHTYAEAGSYRVALHLLRGSEVYSAFANVVAGTPYSFVERVVTPAVSYANDLYEPTIEVSDTGALYITGHTILVDTTGAPAFVSHDDGLTWAQMPFFSDLTLPEPLPGATPPPSDEMFLIAGDDGWVYGVDITLATFPVNAWSGDGTELGYHNPNAYDESDAAGCIGVPVKDRPWGAYAAGALLMVNNPGGGPAQVGVLRVPPELPAGAGFGAAQWNLCAGPGGSIPGIPDVRPDGLFAVPQIDSDDRLTLTLGNVANVMDVRTVELFQVETGGEITSVYGVAAFDAAGTLFAGISNNPDGGDEGGAITIAASTDGGDSFVVRDFETGDKPLRHFYMDPNDFGTGALVVWAVEGDSADGFDWYTGHVQLAADGGAVLEAVMLAVDEGPMPSAHVTGAAVGPDGRAYLAMYEIDPLLGTPLSVYVQQDGPRLPAAVPLV